MILICIFWTRFMLKMYKTIICLNNTWPPFKVLKLNAPHLRIHIFIHFHWRPLWRQLILLRSRNTAWYLVMFHNWRFMCFQNIITTLKLAKWIRNFKICFYFSFLFSPFYIRFSSCLLDSVLVARCPSL